ncbi:MAG: hypothetical protein JNM64_09760 [Chloroflexia bacterium]|nr:hypothetical protein [Chloroflexia bacterium]
MEGTIWRCKATPKAALDDLLYYRNRRESLFGVHPREQHNTPAFRRKVSALDEAIDTLETYLGKVL